MKDVTKFGKQPMFNPDGSINATGLWNQQRASRLKKVKRKYTKKRRLKTRIGETVKIDPTLFKNKIFRNDYYGTKNVAFEVIHYNNKTGMMKIKSETGVTLTFHKKYIVLW